MSSTVAQALAMSRLPVAEAQTLLAATLGENREALIAHPERVLDSATLARFKSFVARRHSGEPIAYLVERQEFYGYSFVLNSTVLIPRPETELLVELGLKHIETLPSPRVLDLGTGSGCIAISLALENRNAIVTALDYSSAALTLARANAERLGAHVEFLDSDWFSAVRGTFDLIVANPPYVAPNDPHLNDLRFEPACALTAEDDGLSAIKIIVRRAAHYLNAGGALMIEHGYNQGAQVRPLFQGAGFTEVRSVRDAAHHERVCVGVIL